MYLVPDPCGFERGNRRQCFGTNKWICSLSTNNGLLVNERSPQLNGPREIPMTLYKSFHVDLPIRCQKLHGEFLKLARDHELEVTYTLMRLTSAFLLPFERVVNDNKLGPGKKKERTEIRGELEINNKFVESSYYGTDGDWTYYKMKNKKFFEGYNPEKWAQDEGDFCKKDTQHLFAVIRNAVAHSNLLFACDENDNKIVYICFGSKERENGKETGRYSVIGCNLNGLNKLLDEWCKKLNGIGHSSDGVILEALEEAA